MFRYLVAVSFAFSLSAHADGIPLSKQQECGQKAWLFSMAAQYRDSRLSPQEFLKYVQHNHPNPLMLDSAYIKKATNAVYFDERFADLSSDVLYQSIAEACSNPVAQYQPIQ
jgi:hypothetical protein